MSLQIHKATLAQGCTCTWVVWSEVEYILYKGNHVYSRPCVVAALWEGDTDHNLKLSASQGFTYVAPSVLEELARPEGVAPSLPGRHRAPR